MSTIFRCGICAAFLQLASVNAFCEDSKKPIVGGDGKLKIGTSSSSTKWILTAEVDTGADRSSVDAVGFESVKFSELAVGDDLEFWIVTERRKRPGSAPAIWEIVQKKRAIAKYHGTKRVNGENRPLVKVWIKYPGAKPVPLIVNLNSRNKRERMLLGEDFTDGKLVDTELTFGDAW